MLIPYWNHAGDVHQLEPYPSSFHDWVLGEDLPPDQRALHDAVEAAIGHTIVRTSCRAMDMNLTLDATLDNGTSIIVRRRHSQPSDSDLEQWNLTKFRNEIYLLRWLKDNSSLPVPNILAVGQDFTIQEKMPGSTLALKWHSFSDSTKARFLASYIEAVCKIFSLSVAQRIGSASFEESSSDIINVGHRLASSPAHSSAVTFDDLTSYLSFLISIKRRAIEGMEVIDRERAEEVLQSVEKRISDLLTRINDPPLLRCVLTHGDLHSYNILVDDDGQITAIVDWEINYSQPAIIGVDYPLWLLDEGPFDPRFASKTYWWDESPAERKRLRQEFEQESLLTFTNLHMD